MKIRLGFVGNSSSSSFIIPKEFLSPDQIARIYNHAKFAPSLDESFDEADVWDVIETESGIIGRTFMDNFDMHHYLTEILHIPESFIEWGDYGDFD